MLLNDIHSLVVCQWTKVHQTLCVV